MITIQPGPRGKVRICCHGGHCVDVAIHKLISTSGLLPSGGAGPTDDEPPIRAGGTRLLFEADMFPENAAGAAVLVKRWPIADVDQLKKTCVSILKDPNAERRLESDPQTKRVFIFDFQGCETLDIGDLPEELFKIGDTDSVILRVVD